MKSQMTEIIRYIPTAADRTEIRTDNHYGDPSCEIHMTKYIYMKAYCSQEKNIVMDIVFDQRKERLLEYLGMRWVIHPCNGKVPVIKGWNKLTTNVSKVAVDKHYKEYSNWGVLTGNISNIIVLDIDSKDKGVEFWNGLIERHNEIYTRKIQTGSGGYHYYFKYEDWMSVLKSRAKIKVNGESYGIDLKTNGGQIILDESIHPDTRKKYSLIYNVPIITMPEWLAEFCQQHFSVGEKKIKVRKESYNAKNDQNDRVEEEVRQGALQG